MLYPQSNPYRQVKDLSGFWDFQFDPQNQGVKKGWFKGLRHSRPIAVPASWNDQLEEGKNNLGPAWYQTRFDLPSGFKGQKVFLRFDSVNYLADVWLNGVKLGSHEGGHLPFVFEITSQVLNSNLLVVRVDGQLAPDRVPPGVQGGDVDGGAAGGLVGVMLATTAARPITEERAQPERHHHGGGRYGQGELGPPDRP